MKNVRVVMVALVFLSIMGCGGSTSDSLDTAEVSSGEEGGAVSQFSTCSANCGPNLALSCTGSVCSSEDGVGVTCDGVFQSCDFAVCTGLSACSQWANTLCSPVGAQRDCCQGTALARVVCRYENGPSSRTFWRLEYVP